MPFKVTAARNLLIMGELNAEIVTKYLTPLSLHPFLSGNKALGVVGAVEYRNSSAGKYNEFFLAFFASSNPIQGRLTQVLRIIIESNPIFNSIFRSLFSPREEVELVVYKMFVTTETSLLVGHHVWGYPKEIASITFNDRGNDNMNEEGELLMIGDVISTIDSTKMANWNLRSHRADHHHPSSSSSSLPTMTSLINQIVRIITSVIGYPKIALIGTTTTTDRVIYSKGRAKSFFCGPTFLFDSSIDRLELNIDDDDDGDGDDEDNGWKSFNAMVWVSSSRMEAILFPPFFLRTL